MLQGDLAATSVAQVLTELADAGASGCLLLTPPDGEVARIYLRTGRVYAVAVPGRRPQIGVRLVSGGFLGPEALAEALEAQRTELQGWRPGELLVHLGCVDPSVVEAFVREQLRDGLFQLLGYRSGTWRLRINERTREDVVPPSDVPALLADIELRRRSWVEVVRCVHGPEAVPMLSSAPDADAHDQREIDADAWSLLCKVDGVHPLAELADECGLTLYEAGHVVAALVEAGLLEVEPRGSQAEGILSDQGPESEWAWGPEPGPDTAALASRLVEQGLMPGPAVPVQARHCSGEPDLDLSQPSPRHLETPPGDATVDGSISRVSEALSAMLGPGMAGEDMFAAPLNRPRRPAPGPSAPDPRAAERASREGRRRDRDAQELALAQADLEQARATEQARRQDLLPAGHVAEVVDLQQVRQVAEAAERARTEQAALVAEQARLAEEHRQVEQVRAAEEARRAAEADEYYRQVAQAREAEQAAARAREAEETRQREEAEQAGLAAEFAAQQAEEARLAVELAKQQAEEARLATEAAERLRQEEEERQAEEARRVAEHAARQAEEAQVAEQVRQAEEARVAEQARQHEEARQAEQARLAAEHARQLDHARHAAASAELAAMAYDGPPDPQDRRLSAETSAAAFAELTAAASLSLAEPVPASAPQWDGRDNGADNDDARDDDDDDDDMMPSYAAADTDTAALLRELTSLGLENDAPASSEGRVARSGTPRPVSAAAQKKRKGLFGRG